MRLSRFNLYVDDYPTAGQTLVHNTLSGSYVVFDEDVLAALRKAESGRSLDANELVLVDDPELYDPDVGVITASYEEEEAEFREWFAFRRNLGSTLHAIVGINLACNFDCPYCSQAEVMDGSVMTPEVVDQTAAWLAQRAIKQGLEGLHLILVGGEPLLHRERIKRLATGARSLLDRHGMRFTMAVITNGYFLDADTVSDLAALGLVHAQVTLDGDETTHCLTRVSKRGDDSFHRIFDNVVAASRHIRVTVNGNYQENTVDGFAPLLQKLAEAGFPTGAKVTFSPALAGLSSSEGVGSGACTWSGSDTSHQIALYDETLRRGFDPGGPANVVGPCEFHDYHSFAIDPDGTVYKCPGFLGHPDWGIGHVQSGLTSRYEEMLTLTPKNGCTGCSHRPNCGGGCVAAEWIQAGNTDGVNCEKDYFDLVKDESVVRGFLLATENTQSEAVAKFPAPKRGPRLVETPLPAVDRSKVRSARLRVIAA